MSRVLVIGDYLIDRYVFYQQQRYDPANSQAPVVKLVSDCVVQGGAANFVRNLQEMVDFKTQVKKLRTEYPNDADFGQAVARLLNEQVTTFPGIQNL